MSSTRKIDKHGRDYWTGQAIIRYPATPYPQTVGAMLEYGIDVDNVPRDHGVFFDGYLTFRAKGTDEASVDLNDWPSEEARDVILAIYQEEYHGPR